jgi:uncharacterized phage protein (TIGR02220 family)
MTGWTCMHQKIVASSVWSAKYHVRIAWVTLLACADRNGLVQFGVVGLQRMANITMEETVEAIAILSAPDPDTITQEKQGRRIEVHERGFLIVNHERYRQAAWGTAAREKEAIRKAMSRQSEKVTGKSNPPPSPLPLTPKSTPPHPTPPQACPDKSGTCPDKCGENERVCAQNARICLHWLNDKSGRHFRETGPNLTVIMARLRETGVDLEGVKRMIARQCQRWLDTSQAEYLRPETLFGKTKFDSYYAARDLPVNEQQAGIGGGKPAEKPLALRIAENI